MPQTIVHLHSQYRIGAVDPRLFGGFLEHMGRAVYEGVYQPDHPRADTDGFRTDVLDALRPLRMTAMRYPGGNFASGYHWRDGVGPREQRPTVRELAWQSIEPNTFGTDEFITLCRRLDWTPMLTVNLGTGTPEEARDWVEYCNAPVGTRIADQRAANDHPEPYGVPLWCLGNEMDGPWQLGHVPAEQYAIRAQQAAKMMKDVDPVIELVVCGSCGVSLPTYMDWDRQVLEHMGGLADHVSLHRYVGNRTNDLADYLAIGNAIDRQLEEMDAACRFVRARSRRNQRTFLCFDEWNVWYKNHETNGRGQHAPHLIEEVYNLEDALVVAAFFHSFLRHADVLKIANIAQIVNVIAPVLTGNEGVLRQSIWYAFKMFSERRDGVSLRLAVDGPAYEGSTHGKVPVIDASAVLANDRLHVFLTNRGETAANVRLQPADFALGAMQAAELLTGPDPKAANTWEQPETVVSQPFDRVTAGTVELPPLSLAALTFALD